MAQHNKLGSLGESLAVSFLEKKGYVILERNWYFEKAEIDIIALSENYLVVVEVKTRSSIEFGLPQDFINKKKINRLIRAINHYVELKEIENEIRFDIIAIHKTSKETSIEHLENAFYHF